VFIPGKLGVFIACQKHALMLIAIYAVFAHSFLAVQLAFCLHRQ
jgi:hypothetical protein